MHSFNLIYWYFFHSIANIYHCLSTGNFSIILDIILHQVRIFIVIIAPVQFSQTTHQKKNQHPPHGDGGALVFLGQTPSVFVNIALVNCSPFLRNHNSCPWRWWNALKEYIEAWENHCYLAHFAPLELTFAFPRKHFAFSCFGLTPEQPHTLDIVI